MTRTKNAKWKIHSRVEPVFAGQRDLMDLFIRTVGIVRDNDQIRRISNGCKSRGPRTAGGKISVASGGNRT